jgi:hypothetical protein
MNTNENNFTPAELQALKWLKEDFLFWLLASKTKTEKVHSVILFPACHALKN